MNDVDCVTDPTIVACTGEATGRDTGDGVPAPVESTPAPDTSHVPAVTETAVAVEVAPVELASTGVPLVPYAIGALTFILVGALLVSLAARDWQEWRRGR